jgi:uncharacterized membrane protein YcjF (UPF0283 family)
MAALHFDKRIVLEDAPAVRALRASLAYSRPNAEVSISDSSLAEGERQWWEQRLSRYYPACGCTLGAMLMSLTVLIGTVDTIRQWWTTAIFPGATLAVVVMASLLAAVLGKIIGLFLGHVRMSRALHLLETRLEQP